MAFLELAVRLKAAFVVAPLLIVVAAVLGSALGLADGWALVVGAFVVVTVALGASAVVAVTRR